jgi:hypothetical protein
MHGIGPIWYAIAIKFAEKNGHFANVDIILKRDTKLVDTEMFHSAVDGNSIEYLVDGELNRIQIVSLY